MLSAGFKPEISEIRLPQTYAVDSTVIGVGETNMLEFLSLVCLWELRVIIVETE